MVSKAIHLGREPKSEDKNICWDFLPTNGGQLPLTEPAKLHPVNVGSETLQAKLLQLSVVLSTLSTSGRGGETRGM